jgi:WD40 repeat protein
LLATGGEDGRVRIWDLNDPQNLKVLTGHTSAVLAVAFSPEGNFLVSGSIDHTGRLWDLAAPDDLPRILPTGTGSVVFVDFLTDQEDKEMVMIGVDDGRLFLWPVPTRILAAYVCDKVWRNLTQEEWETFLGLGISYQPTCENLPLETP